MTRYVAFLRAVNVGGRTIRMDRLQELFIGLGFQDVATFLASGNVMFGANGTMSAKVMEKVISERLRDAMGYEVATFVRSAGDVALIAGYEPFPQDSIVRAATFNVALLKEPLAGNEERSLMDMTTDIDAFATNGREVYWLCREKQSRSSFSNAVLERRLHLTSTMRAMNTMRRLAARGTGD